MCNSTAFEIFLPRRNHCFQNEAGRTRDRWIVACGGDQAEGYLEANPLPAAQKCTGEKAEGAGRRWEGEMLVSNQLKKNADRWSRGDAVISKWKYDVLQEVVWACWEEVACCVERKLSSLSHRRVKFPQTTSEAWSSLLCGTEVILTFTSEGQIPPNYEWSTFNKPLYLFFSGKPV